ncbi:MAG: ribosome maturation factor RimP [Clostridiales bacterium]|nr:ribosome maturation factor RimP [Clostridiales bacterium]
MGKVSEQVMSLVQPIAQSFGLEVIEVLYEKKYDGMNLTIVIDKDGGVTIDDCEKLHRAIDEPLDKLDPIDTSYILNVSSPGIDRPLKTERDYKRNFNKKILVRLYTPLDNKKSYEGVLVAYDEDTFTVELKNGKQITFIKKDTAKVEPVIEF